MIIYDDNSRAIILAKNLESHAQNKYINIQWNYQCKQIEDGFVKFKYNPTKEQITNSFTKALIREKFLIFCHTLSIE